MKKVKLSSNFLSAADKLIGAIAALFTTQKVKPAPIRVRVPKFPRR